MLPTCFPLLPIPTPLHTKLNQIEPTITVNITKECESTHNMGRELKIRELKKSTLYHSLQQRDRQREKQTDRHADRDSETNMGWGLEIREFKKINTVSFILTERQTQRETDRQTDMQTETVRQRDTEMSCNYCFYYPVYWSVCPTTPSGVLYCDFHGD